MLTGVLNRNGVLALGLCALIAGCGDSLQDPAGDEQDRTGDEYASSPVPQELAPDSAEYERAKMALVGTPTLGSVPVLEPFSASLAPLASASAIVQDTGCLARTLGPSDDGSTPRIALPFSINFFGTTQNSLFINNNGNVTFNSPLGTFTPFSINAQTPPIIAPFFADVDTRNAASGIVQFSNAPIVFGGRPAMCVNWVRVGYFSLHVDKLNSFQLLLVDRNDTGVGNFDIVMNYDQILWETGDASGGIGGFGGTPAGAGFSAGNGNPAAFFQYPGSLVRGGLLDGNGVTGLSRTSHFSAVVGRHIFGVRSGQPITDELITLAPLSDTARVGTSHTVSGSIAISGTVNTQLIGSYPVNYDVTDPTGHAAPTQTRIVNVVDTNPPQVIVTPVTQLWPPNHSMHSFQLSDCAITSDTCTGSGDINERGTIISIFSDEPEDANDEGDGHTLGDIVITGNSSFSLRAERQGGGNGRVYGVNFVVTDGNGNATAATCYFAIPHDQSGESAIDDGAGAGYTVSPR